MRFSHLLRYYLSFKGTLLCPEVTLIMIFDDINENSFTSDDVFETLQNIVTFEDFIEYWCRLCASRLWKSEYPVLENGLFAAAPDVPDLAESSEVISRRNIEQPPPHLSKNLLQLLNFIADDSASIHR